MKNQKYLYIYTFPFFDFSSSLSPFSTFRLCDFSASLSTLNGLSFVLLAAHVQLERHPPKIQTIKKWKIEKYVFRLFGFSPSLSPFDFSVFRFFFFPLDSQRFQFCTFSCACSAGTASAKNSNNQKVKNRKVCFSTFRFFSFPLAFRLFDFSVFRFFFFPLDSQRFKFCTFSCACSAGTASAKNSNNQKVKNKKVFFSAFRLFEINNYPVYSGLTFRLWKITRSNFSTFRNSQRHLSTFRLFIFPFFEIDFAYFPPGALQHIFPQRNAGRGQEKRVPNETVLIHFWDLLGIFMNLSRICSILTQIWHFDTFRSLWDYCHYVQPSSYMILNYTPTDSLEAIVTFKSIICFLNIIDYIYDSADQTM